MGIAFRCKLIVHSCVLVCVVAFVWLRGPPGADLQALPSPGHGRRLANENAPVPVIVLKLPRSGSTWFVALLRAYRGAKKFEDEGFHFVSQTAYAGAPAQMARKLLDDSNRGSAFVGFSLNPFHPRNLSDVYARGPLVHNMLAEVAQSVPNLHIIVLERTNTLHHVCASFGKTRTADTKRVHDFCRNPDPHRLEGQMFRQELAYLLLQMSAVAPSVPVLRVTYEGLQMDTGETLARVAAFLGVPNAFPVASGRVKLKSHTLMAIMRNADDVFRHFGNQTCVIDMLKAIGPKEFPKPCLVKCELFKGA